MQFNIRNEFKFFYDALMRYITFFGSFVFFIIAFLTLMILGQSALAVKFAVGTAISMGIEYAVKLTLRVKRPDFKDVKPISLFEKFQESGSFPSGHSANIALFTTMIYLKYTIPYLAVLFVLISVLVGMSRVYLKRHYARDVIGGYLLGAIVGFLL